MLYSETLFILEMMVIDNRHILPCYESAIPTS